MTPITITLHGRRLREVMASTLGAERGQQQDCRHCALVSLPLTLCQEANRALAQAVGDRRAACYTRRIVWEEVA